MKELEDKIITDGKAIGTEILKVDSFLNHQMDPLLIEHMGNEFARVFVNAAPDKILTVESSGIAIAYAAAKSFGNIPLVFAKKSAPSTMIDGCYSADVRSFTKGTVSTIRVAKDYLKEGERVLIIDDFLATGEAALGLLEIIDQAGAVCVGAGAAIEKYHQGGSRRLREKGIEVHSLAVISSLHDGTVDFM